MQLRALVFFLFLPSLALGDQVVFRGNYYRDRNTRVLIPEVEFSKESRSGTVLGGHYLLDAITSASAAAGVVTDQPFTELRNEFGVSVGQRIGPARLSAGYAYSSESDYWAHLATLGVVLDLFQHNTTLAGSIAYGVDYVGQRQGAGAVIPKGSLQSFHAILSLSQVLTPRVLANLSYELDILGFGSDVGSVSGTPTPNSGYQGNPYRTVLVAGSPTPEAVPFQRYRQEIAGSLHLILPTPLRLMPYITFRPGYRFYFDDWGILSHAPEMRSYVPMGPVELRLTGRYYQQTEASFWSEIYGKPNYTESTGKRCTTCYFSQSRKSFYTSDPKLAAFSALYFELRLLIDFSQVRRRPRSPFGKWLGDAVLEFSYGHYFNSGYSHTAFGDADIGGLAVTLPL